MKKARQKIYQVDAFTNELFSGNPAAVCPLEFWPDSEIMQKIAFENNLSETAFYVKKDHFYEIRWFTPTVEVDLCGHATLAAAFILFFHENHNNEEIRFLSPRSGELKVTRNGNLLTLDFPADIISEALLTEQIRVAFSKEPVAVFKGKTDYLLVYKNESEIKELIPDFERIAKLEVRGVIVTAKGDSVDFVSRFFAPQSGVNEDPVTGSAHTTLTPYWSAVLGKNELTAIQLSNRKGYLNCKFKNNRVEISGHAKLYLKGEIYIE